MSKALNVICGLAILWIFLHGIWNAFNFEGFSGELEAPQRFEGILALAVGVALLTIFLKIRRK